ncbi:MAG TPA: tRNA (adenosine(37)-N6)-threonylcarbamoyltransferase complex ATPase subunit type 1 TsaE [Defluviitaleaceae bacterium]|jgi:tRNA threonylcarbamoyladenosine biosynthesis protein TsaE|nr:tRNA (adenosine(37)-N6)-threonylcarbamoyltransferase complex ATPase subunit type 1 TsaE [Candidatus Epulonipiscium sp.]HOA81362.1 tRNA (adenosine(37)-N6)-threonylcarbamoyltransferase complex ATPase subunit type 1 TsaE [Defluviitaleaceae bacterium]
MIYETFSEEETKELGRKIASKAQKGDIYCLIGDLGVGKTAFAKGLAKGLDIKEAITSPTFTVVNEYQGRLPLYHFDVYRITDIDEMEEIGYEEYFYGDGICLIEWADMIEELIPDNAIWINIIKDLDKADNYRKIIIENKKEM